MSTAISSIPPLAALAARQKALVELHDSDLLTRRRAAEYLGVAPQTLAVWACTGRYGLPFIKVGRSVKYRKSDLDAWLAKNTATQTA